MWPRHRSSKIDTQKPEHVNSRYAVKPYQLKKKRAYTRSDAFLDCKERPLAQKKLTFRAGVQTGIAAEMPAICQLLPQAGIGTLF